MQRHRKRPKMSGQIGKGKSPCAFCKHHHATLTVHQMKKHKCLEKQCAAFVKWANHEYWHQQECRKAKREETKRIRREEKELERTLAETNA